MLVLAEAVLFTAALLTACAGLGGTILRWAKLEEPGELGPARAVSTGVSAALGLAVLIALGGLGTVLRIPVALSFPTFVAIGIGLLLTRVIRVRPPWTPVWVVVILIEVVGLGLVLVSQAGVGLAFPFNPCDDILAYLPEARRLLVTRTLLEPWSTRRLQTFGGQTFLQASYIRFLGKDALALTETVLPIALLWLLVTTPVRRPLTRLLSVVPLLFLPFFDVPRSNTAGSLSPVPLLVALGVLVLVLRRASQQQNRRGRLIAAAAVGITAIAAIVLRSNVAPAAVLVAVVGTATIPGTSRDRLQTVGACAVSAIAAFTPWALTMWESSGTPLYPLLHGNENQSVPSVGGNLSVSVGDFVHNAWHFATNCTYPIALLVLLSVAVAAWRVFVTSAMTLTLMAIAGLINVLILTVAVSLVPSFEFDRYTFPLAASVLFLLLRSAFIRLDEEPSLIQRSAIRPELVTITVLIAFFWLGTSRPASFVAVHDIATARSFVEKAADLDGSDERLTPNNAVANAREILAALPDRPHAILAVSDPDAFLSAGADLQSMDQPGSAAPGSTFPFFSGPLAKARAIRKRGYDFLIVTPSSMHPCFQRGRIEGLSHSSVPGYRLLAPYVLDFFDDMDALVARHPDAARIIGGTYVIDLSRITGTTPRS